MLKWLANRFSTASPQDVYSLRAEVDALRGDMERLRGQFMSLRGYVYAKKGLVGEDVTPSVAPRNESKSQLRLRLLAEGRLRAGAAPSVPPSEEKP